MDSMKISEEIKRDLQLYLFSYDCINHSFLYFKSNHTPPLIQINILNLQDQIKDILLSSPQPSNAMSFELNDSQNLSFSLYYEKSDETNIVGFCKDISIIRSTYDYKEQILSSRDTFVEVNHALINTNDTSTLLSLIIERTIDLYKISECGTILSLDDGYLTVSASYGYDKDYCKSFKKRYTDSYQWHMTKKGFDGPIIVNNLVDMMISTGFEPFSGVNNEIIQSTISAPIIINNKLAGMINIDTTKNNYYTNYHLDIISYIAEQVSLVVDKHMLYQRIKTLSENDHLTQIYNRRTFEKKFTALIQLNKTLHLVIIDINKFKDINDSIGHDAGDAVLIDFANRLKKIVNPVDIISRLNGDEFAIGVIPKNNNDITKKLFELKEDIKINPLHYKTHTIAYTFSYGIAHMPTDGHNYEVLFKIADNNMYKNKLNIS